MGDRDGLEEFNGAFVGLQGDDAELTDEQIEKYYNDDIEQFTIPQTVRVAHIVFHPSGDYIIIAFEDKLLLIYMKNSFMDNTCNMKIPDFINYENGKLEE